MSIHIAYLVQQFPPEVGAGPARVSEMTTRWIAAGAEVTVVTGMPNRPQGSIYRDYKRRVFLQEDFGGVRVLRSWLYASPRDGVVRTLANNTTFMATAAAHAIARLRGVDVLIASSPPFFPHVAGWLTSATRRLPLVIEIRDLWPDYLVGLGVLSSGGIGARGLFACERFMIQSARRTVVVTESFKRRVIQKGAPRSTVSVLPNGVDSKQYFRTDEPPPFPSMKRTTGEEVVGYLGNMGAGQDLAAVVRAAGLLRDRLPQVRFVFAGDGPDRKRIEALVVQLGLSNIEVYGAIPKSQTRAFYNACDVCLVPLANIAVFQETVPSKIFEILACERPVLASAAGEAAIIIEQSGAGLAVAPADSKGIASGIVELLEMDDATRRTMGRRGREYVCTHYDRGVIATRYMDLLKEVAAGS